MTSLSNAYNTSSVQATQTAPSLPITVISQVTGTQGYQLHHPQRHLIPATSGIILPFPTVPTSPREPAPPITEPLPPPQPTIPASSSGINLSRTRSSHPSLYQSSRSQLPDCLADPHGKRSMSETSRPLSDMSHGSNIWIGQGGQSSLTQTQQPMYSPRRSTSMESMGKASHPQSWRSNPSPRQLLRPPPMTLTDTIHLFGAVNMTQPPDVLLHADYYNLFITLPTNHYPARHGQAPMPGSTIFTSPRYMPLSIVSYKEKPADMPPFSTTTYTQKHQ